MSKKALFILSLLIACGLWFYVYMEGSYEEYVKIPIDLTAVPDGMMAAVHPSEATVRLSGPQALVLQAASELKIYVNANEFTMGVNMLRISPGDIDSPGLEVLDVSPSRFEVTVENTIKHDIPVEPFILDIPPVGYKLGALRVIPEKVTVEGLQKDFAQIANVQTKYISVKDYRADARITVGILDYSEFKSIVPDTVVVELSVVEDIITRVFTLVAVRCSDDSIKLASTPQITLRLAGRRDLMDFSDEDNLAYLDCSAVTGPGEYTVPVYAAQLDRMTVNSIAPVSVNIEVVD
jgi:hypothetical protein